ncbi:hypothetical protein HAX54_042876 [Datura stramonium]|uniref:Uncharacterized protein n=1 Tax=Datura stramonium TaxID=4076 RepID=A0ABS8W2G2_DATST|nr:hypothetical protein [Datura stramonium]
MDPSRHSCGSCSSRSSRRSRLPWPIQQVSDPGQWGIIPARFVSTGFKGNCSFRSSASPQHDPEQCIALVRGLYWSGEMKIKLEARKNIEKLVPVTLKQLYSYEIETEVFDCAQLTLEDFPRTWERAKFAETLIKLELKYVMKLFKSLVRNAVFSTAVTSLKPEDAFDPNRVKCVVGLTIMVMHIFFTRPYPYNKSGKVNPQFPYLLHLGIQSYDIQSSKIYPELTPTPLQLEEDLEQLKVLRMDTKMKVTKADHEAHGADTPTM